MNREPFDMVRLLFTEATTAYDQAKAIVKGRKVRIISDYNAQPYGSSKPSLRGEIVTIIDLHFDPYWGITFGLMEYQLYIPMIEVELVESHHTPEKDAVSRAASERGHVDNKGLILRGE